MSTSEEFYEYLKNNFKNVKVLSNGVYYAKDNNGNTMYFNPKAISNMNVVVSFPGSGGGDEAHVASVMNSSNPPEYCAFVSGSCTDKGNIYATINKILKNGNVNLNGLVASSFSASGGMGMAKAAEFVSAHPEYADKVSVVVNTGNWVLNQKNSVYNTLKEYQIPVTVISGADKTESDTNVKELTKKGIVSYRITTDDKTHVYIPIDTFKNGIPEYILDVRDNIGNKGVAKNPNYKIYKYDASKGKFVSVDISSIKLNTILNPDSIQIINPSELLANDGFKITPKDIDAIDDFADLKNIEDLKINTSVKLANAESIKSDMDLILQAMNGIRSKIKSSNFLSSGSRGSLYSYRTAGIPGCINAYVNAYFDYVGDLMDKLVEETEAIQSVGQVMVDMDNDLAERGESLGTVKELERTPKKRTKKKDLEKEENKSKENKKNKTSKRTNKNESDNDRTSNGRKHYGGGGSSESGEKEEILSYDRNDGSKLVISSEGDNVTGISYVYEFNTEEEARVKYEELVKQYENDNNVQAINLIKKRVEVVFKSSVYKSISPAEARKKFK